jgi:hypothetical protein
LWLIFFVVCVVKRLIYEFGQTRGKLTMEYDDDDDDDGSAFVFIYNLRL